MKTSKFKTNAKCDGCVAKIESLLNTELSREQWSIDLNSPDKVLTVTSNLPDSTIIKLVNEAGFKADKIG